MTDSDQELIEFRIAIKQIMSENIDLYERKDDPEKVKLANNIYDKIRNLYITNKKPSVNLISSKESPILTVLLYADPSAVPEPRYYPTENSIKINCFKNNYNLFKNRQYVSIINLLKNELIHEITHFLDDVRTNTLFIQHNFKANRSEYTTPAEFNAYFIGFSSKMYDDLRTCATTAQFNYFFGKDVYEFLQKFNNYAKTISPNMYKELSKNKIYETKWNKRVYQLYFELKSKFNGEPLDNFYNDKRKNESRIIRLKD